MEESMVGGMQAECLLKILLDLVMAFEDGYTHIKVCRQYEVCAGCYENTEIPSAASN
jgi:hypothetical protein